MQLHRSVPVAGEPLGEAWHTIARLLPGPSGTSGAGFFVSSFPLKVGHMNGSAALCLQHSSVTACNYQSRVGEGSRYLTGKCKESA